MLSSRKSYDFSFPKPKNIKTEIFVMIETQRTDELIELITLNKDQYSNMIAQNYWNIAMYAVRYGDHKLMRFLNEQDMLHEHSQCSYSLIHAACFNNDVKTLKVLIDELGKDPNQYGVLYSENCPLRYAYKNDQFKTIEFLCSRGAYYQYLNLSNNHKVIKDSQNQMQNLNTLKQIVQALTVFRTTKKSINFKFQKSPIKTTKVKIRMNKLPHLQGQKDFYQYINRFMRFRNLFFVKRQFLYNQQNPETYPINSKLKMLAYFFTQDKQFAEVLAFAAPSASSVQ